MPTELVPPDQRASSAALRQSLANGAAHLAAENARQPSGATDTSQYAAATAAVYAWREYLNAPPSTQAYLRKDAILQACRVGEFAWTRVIGNLSANGRNPKFLGDAKMLSILARDTGLLMP